MTDSSGGGAQVPAFVRPAPRKVETFTLPEPTLVPVGAATDPHVQHMIADLHAARANGDSAEAERITKEITALGYRV